MYNIGCYLMKA